MSERVRAEYVPEQPGEPVLGIAMRDIEAGEWVTLKFGGDAPCDIDGTDEAILRWVNQR